MSKTLYILSIFAVLLVAAAGERDLTKIISHVKAQIESDISELRKSFESEMSTTTYNLLEKTKPNYDQEIIVLNEVKKYSALMKSNISALRESQVITSSIDDCMFEAESDAIESFNTVLKMAWGCMIQVQGTIIESFSDRLAAIKLKAKAAATAWSSRLESCLDITCVNEIFREAFLSYDSLFYERLTLSFQFHNVNSLDSVNNCVTKYSRDVVSEYNFSIKKISGCLEGSLWEIPTEAPSTTTSTTTTESLYDQYGNYRGNRGKFHG